jgi:hypothetical protein
VTRRRLSESVAVIVVLAFTAAWRGETGQSHGLRSELERLHVKTALVVRSDAIDRVPVWGPDNDRIAIDIGGTWKTVSLSSLTLGEGSWHGGERIGVAQSPKLTAVEPSTVDEWMKTGIRGARRVETSNGLRLELTQDDLSTRLVLTRRNAPSKTLWRTGLENCHGLSLSGDERLVAFTCELGGLLVMSVED